MPTEDSRWEFGVARDAGNPAMMYVRLGRPGGPGWTRMRIDDFIAALRSAFDAEDEDV